MSAAMNMLELPCVVLDAQMAKHYGIADKGQLPAPTTGINELVLKLAALKPLWTFAVNRPNSSGFDVYENGEKLGEVGWTYFRNTYGYVIENERIAKTKQRSNSHRTSDVKKALATIKKTFYRQNYSERFAAAFSAIDKLIHSESYEKQRRVNKAKHDLDARAQEFAYSLQGEFMKFLEAKGAKHVWELHQTANLEMLTIESAKKAFKNQDAVVVLRTDGQYVVKSRDKVKLMDDTTLPSWLKAKLGMLKLVEDEHIVSDVGCRIHAECFMVLANGEGDEL